MKLKPKQEINFNEDMFTLIAQAKPLCRQLGLSFDKVRAEMTTGDYNNLIKVYNKYFNKMVSIET